MWGNVPGGYRNTINDNVVLIEMIETLEGLKDADEIAKVPGVSAVFAASGDLGNFSGFRQGTPDYERAINIVHDAAIKAGKRLCGPMAWRDRPDFTCFQAASETAAIARGVAAELGNLANTQGKPEVGPFAAPPKPRAFQSCFSGFRLRRSCGETTKAEPDRGRFLRARCRDWRAGSDYLTNARHAGAASEGAGT